MKKIDWTLFQGMLIVCVLVGSNRGASAQELLNPPAAGPPQMELPSVPAVGSGSRGSGSRGSGMGGSELGGELPSMASPTPASRQPGQNFIAAPIASGDLQLGLQPIETGDEYRIFDCEPALLESTGTWLRRGFWYTEVDVLLMDLIWARNDDILAFQTGTTNTLFLEGGRQGAEATPRLKLGRFLFRDHKNRDHAAEFIAYGGGQWTKSGRLDAVNGGTLTSVSNSGNNQVPSGGNISFTGATSTQYDYDSRFNSFELNYHIKSRMRKDRMELEPSGRWVRRAQPTMSRSLIAGIRYFNLNEDFDWDAFGINDANGDVQSGNYRVRTDNDLFGPQLGFSITYETARWSLGVKNKSGIYINSTDVDSDFEVTGGITSGDNNIRVDNISFITEGALTGKLHLRPNFSLRAGLEILFVTSVAHASEQINFVPVSTSQIVAAGDSTFMGATIGFEGYW